MNDDDKPVTSSVADTVAMTFGGIALVGLLIGFVHFTAWLATLL